MTIPFERTTCDCPSCAAGCRTMPGSLIPGDVEKILATLPVEVDRWAWFTEHFAASEGSVIQYIDPEKGMVQERVPTIVPRQNANGECYFLTETGRCAIHAVSPYGCAYHDTHMSEADGYARSHYAVMQQRDRATPAGVHYAIYWAALKELGNVVASLLERRTAFQQAVEAIEDK